MNSINVIDIVHVSVASCEIHLVVHSSEFRTTHRTDALQTERTNDQNRSYVPKLRLPIDYRYQFIFFCCCFPFCSTRPAVIDKRYNFVQVAAIGVYLKTYNSTGPSGVLVGVLMTDITRASYAHCIRPRTGVIGSTG
jgi:hypothetical protein